MSQVTFQGSPAKEILKRAPRAQRLLGNLLLRKEGANGRAEITFLQDTMVALMPKAVVSRSKTELSEVGFLEILESIVIYFSVPWGAKKLFYPFFGKMLPKNAGIHATDLLKPIKQLEHLPKDKLMRILAGKAAIIMSALTLTGIGGEYAINYAKNLMTAHIFKKDKFSDVVNLSKGEMTFGKESPVVEKAKRRLYQTLGVCAGVFVASMAGVKLFPKMLSRMSADTRKDLIEGPMRSIVEFFDFGFKDGAYGLTKKQMGAYMAISIPAYLDSARDRLEKWESATRLSIVLPYLLWGQDKLEQFPLFKGLFEYSSIMKATGNGRFRMKDLDEIAEGTIQKSLDEYLKKYPQKAAEFAKMPADIFKLPQEVLEIAVKKFKSPLIAKGAHVGVPLGVGILGAGIGVGMLNRYWTRYRYNKECQSEPVQINTLSSSPVSVLPPSLPHFQAYVQWPPMNTSHLPFYRPQYIQRNQFTRFVIPPVVLPLQQINKQNTQVR